jgi:hypothetical protein
MGRTAVGVKSYRKQDRIEGENKHDCESKAFKRLAKKQNKIFGKAE